jgi:hypothetical protein
MSAIMVLSSTNKKIELRIDKTTTAHFQSVMSYRGSSLIVSVYYLDFSRSTLIVKKFSETPQVSLLRAISKSSFSPTSTSFLLRAFPKIKLAEHI